MTHAPHQQGANFPWRKFLILAIIALVILFLSFVVRSDYVQARLKSIFASNVETGLLESSFAPDREYSSAIGFSAAPFRLRASDGSVVDLRDSAGKNIVLVFQTTWCQYCREELATLSKLSQDSRFTFVSIDIRESADLVTKHREKFGIQYPWYIDETGNVSQWYLVAGTPTHIFINDDGKIVRRETGYRSAEKLEEAIQVMLNS